jgi:hypothetical protein
MHAFSWIAIVLLLLGTTSCKGSEADATEATAEMRARDYVLVEMALESAPLEAWFKVVRALHKAFDQICGDTFCEGEFTNIQSLAFRCSMSPSEGTIGECLWILAGSSEEVTSSTGNVRVTARSFQCKMPIAPATKLADLVKVLAESRRPLETPLPNTTRSLYEGLIECL